MPRLTLTAARLVPDVARRQIAGTVLRYGETGHTSAGPLRVMAANALQFPDDLTTVGLTLEHDRSVIRGHLVRVDNTPERLYVVAQVADGPLGDAALAEAADRGPNGRGGLSFDLDDPVVQDGEIVAGRVAYMGQVHDPAFNSARIDQIVASNHRKEHNMTPEQRARLAALRAQESLTQAEAAELAQLVALDTPAQAAQDEPEAQAPAAASPAAGAAAPIAASLPAVPGGAPTPRRSPATVTNEDALTAFIRTVVSAVGPNGRGAQSITAALTDVTSTQHTGNIEQPAWSGQLWSGLQYEPVFTDLFSSGELANWEGEGWRFVTKPAFGDYAGDKAAIPSGAVTTESQTYTAARMACGHGLDRKFYDFPNEAFLRAYLEAVREDWAIKLDAKIQAYIAANAVAGSRTVAGIGTTNASAAITGPAGTFDADMIGSTISGTGIPGGATIIAVGSSTAATMSANATATGSITATIGYASAKLLKAAGQALKCVKRNTRAKGTFVLVNDDDLFDLFDVTAEQLPAFLEMFGVDPKNFRSDPSIPRGVVQAGVKQAATVRVLPGSPIRVDAQQIANGGVDSGFFGYWATEEHHTSGIVTVKYTG